ncbi:hypothetical protein [Cupriavidus sp. IK-TO18]|uniref:hypothetical protein n=1 Tax=Cupriavidus sp. IK-TO18 TaxID=2782182 RepID=UPI0034CFA6A3
MWDGFRGGPVCITFAPELCRPSLGHRVCRNEQCESIARLNDHHVIVRLGPDHEVRPSTAAGRALREIPSHPCDILVAAIQQPCNPANPGASL